MIDVQLLRTQLDEVAARIASRGASFDADGFRALEAERKSIQTRTQELQSARNAHAKKVGQAKARGEDTTVLVAEAGGINRELGMGDHFFFTLELMEGTGRPGVASKSA